MDELHSARFTLLCNKQSFASIFYQSCDQFLDNSSLSVKVDVVDYWFTWQTTKSSGNRGGLQVRSWSSTLICFYAVCSLISVRIKIELPEGTE